MIIKVVYVVRQFTIVDNIDLLYHSLEKNFPEQVVKVLELAPCPAPKFAQCINVTIAAVQNDIYTPMHPTVFYKPFISVEPSKLNFAFLQM